jgi:GAF domain-containing protein
MKRRSRAGDKPAKARPRNALTGKGRKASKAVTRRGSPPGAHAEVARLTRELKEAQEQQAATADLLMVISQSAFNLQAVLDALVESAARLCEAEMASVVHPEGSVYRSFAHYGYSQNLIEFMETHPVHLGRGTVTGRTILECKPVQIPDVLADPEFTFTEGVKIGGMRTMLGVPLLRDGVPTGVFVLARRTVRPFSDKQIELVQNFAAQAVIAIENARLLDELRRRTADLSQRTTDLTEALEQQTATSKVLQVISSSPGDLQPVFAAMLENAVRTCDAKFGNIYRWDGDALHLVATCNTPPAFAAEARRRSQYRADPKTVTGRMLETKAVVHIADLAAESAYIEERHPAFVAGVELGGVRTILAVPMLKEDKLIGSFTVYRQEVRSFTGKQIALVTNFAAQAVIAIENARLLNELRESLEQQTATSEVLRVISTSPSELQPVFSAILANGARLCEANFGVLVLYENETLRIGAMHNVPDAYAEYRRREPVRVEPQTVSARVAATKELVHVLDYAAEMPDNPVVRLGGARSAVAVPMLKENELLGAIIIYRQEVRAFTEKQIALLTSFAAQAVIAIENTRLLSELHESLQEQTATSEVLQVISSSPGDVQPVFDTMLEKAVRICDAKFGNIYRWDGDALRLVATHNTPPDYAKHRRHSPFRADQNNAVARMIASKKVVHLLDAAANEAYTERRDPTVVAAVELGGIRSALAVPMLREDELIGAFIVSRQEVRPFTDKQIALVTNFAAQAVIAIENTSLLNELRQRTADLTESLEQQN